MKILTTIHSLDVLSKMENNIEIVMGNYAFALRLTKSFSSDDIFIALDKGFKVHLLANRIMNAVMIKSFKAYILDYVKYVESIIVSDLGALNVLINLGYAYKSVYMPENLVTSSLDVKALQALNIKGYYPSKELNISELGLLKKTAPNLLMYYVCHGHLNIFHSKRKLIYMQNGYHPTSKYHLVEEIRKDDKLCVIEELGGFSIFTDKTLLTYQNNELLEMLDYVCFDTIFYDDEYLLFLIDLYVKKRTRVLEILQNKYNDKYISIKEGI